MKQVNSNRVLGSHNLLAVIHDDDDDGDDGDDGGGDGDGDVNDGGVGDFLCSGEEPT